MNKRSQSEGATNNMLSQTMPSYSDAEDSYRSFISGIKQEIRKQRINVVIDANVSMICLYWRIGRAVLEKQEQEGRGTKVIDRISRDLKEAFPDMAGFFLSQHKIYA